MDEVPEKGQKADREIRAVLHCLLKFVPNDGSREPPNAIPSCRTTDVL